METNDVFANEVIIHWPVFGECFLVGAITNCSDVVSKRVEPHVGNMRWIPWQWNSPGECFTAYGEIVQPALNETNDFVHAEARSNGIRMIFVPLQQSIFET